MTEQPIKLSAVIMTFNEEEKIGRCLESLQGVADEIIVVDSFSTDRTEEICLRYGVRFMKNAFLGYVAQRKFTVEQASYDYILALDADEALSDELRKSILDVKKNWGEMEAYGMNRLNNYCGKWLRYSWYPDRKYRLWDKRRARVAGIEPHDIVAVNRASTRKLAGDILHLAYSDIDEHLKQIFRFADMAARDRARQPNKRAYMFMTLVSPLFKFLRKYFIQLGFLDGYYGFVYCAASSSANFFKYLRYNEYRRLMKKGKPI